MPTMKRHSTDYPGVWYVIGQSLTRAGKTEKIFYVQYYKAGKRVEEKVGRQYQDMTPAKAARIRAERIEGKAPTNKERRQGERAKVWILAALWKEYKKNHPDLKGMRTDNNRFEKHLKDYMGNKQPKDILPLDVDRLRLKMLKDHKPATVRNTLELLRRIINFGIDKRLCGGPGFRIKMIEVNNLKTEDLTTTQMRALFKAIHEDLHPYAGPVMKMALFTGMRRGELFKLQWPDVDFERGFISIRNPKGGQDQKIPLNDEARAVLNDLPKEDDSPFVFPGRSGKRRTDIHRAVNAIRDKAGLPKEFRALHGLRHAYASMLASSGQVDLYALQKLLTHKSAAMVQRYAHLRDESLRRASDLAGEIVNEAIKEKKADVVNLDEKRG